MELQTAEATDEFIAEPGLADLMAAYADGDVPVTWTPAHVGVRLVEAFEVLRRTPARIRPQAFGNGWPQIVQGVDVYQDAMLALATGQKVTARSIMESADRETQTILRRDTDERLAREAKRPTAQETSRADEALVWCFEHLRHRPMQAGALQDWALCQAFELSIAKFLRKRAVAVDAAIAMSEYRENDRRKRIRNRVTAEVTVWANEQIAAGIAPAAAIGAARQIIVETVMPVKIKRKEVLPGKCFTKRQMDPNRKFGAAELAKALNKAGVPVR